MALLHTYLNKYESFEDIKHAFEKLGVKVKDSSELYLLKYIRNKTDLSKDYIQECRGIIMSKKNNKIICYPLKSKIHYDTFTTTIDWDDCVIEESIDGTLINLYYYNNKWNTSTNSTIDAKCKWNCDKTFSELFFDTAKMYNLDFNVLNKDFSYSFILCHPLSRNITQYTFPELYHVSSRNLITYLEYDLNIGIKKPKILKLDDYNLLNVHHYKDLIQYVNMLPFNKEGIMLYNKTRTTRTKLKGKEHLIAKQLKGNHPNILYRLLELLKNNDTYEQAQFLKYFPAYTNKLDNLESNMTKLSLDIQYFYDRTKKQRIFTDIPKKYKGILYNLHQDYKYLMSKYDSTIHTYKPCITYKKIQHYLFNMHTTYLLNLIK